MPPMVPCEGAVFTVGASDSSRWFQVEASPQLPIAPRVYLTCISRLSCVHPSCISHASRVHGPPGSCVCIA
eukprot:6203151-Pleurochrysis_carterae.AAC.1